MSKKLRKLLYLIIYNSIELYLQYLLPFFYSGIDKIINNKMKIKRTALVRVFEATKSTLEIWWRRLASQILLLYLIRSRYNFNIF